MKWGKSTCWGEPGEADWGKSTTEAREPCHVIPKLGLVPHLPISPPSLGGGVVPWTNPRRRSNLNREAQTDSIPVLEEQADDHPQEGAMGWREAEFACFPKFQRVFWMTSRANHLFSSYGIPRWETLHVVKKSFWLGPTMTVKTSF